MLADQLFSFGSYRFDPGRGHLWRGKQEVKLTLKAMALFRQLVRQAGQVVTKEELFRTVWPDTVVSDTTLTSCILELRQALRDRAKTPRYIETVHRRGYRFIAPVTATAAPVSSSKFQVPSQQTGGSHQKLETRNQKRETRLVGRDPELAQLHGWLEKALNGERQIVFVTGEPGIGKTTLAETFLEQIVTDGRLWIGRGQCIEHYGPGEAYLPVLEALGRLCRESGGERLIALLNQHAPTWLVQMPRLLSAADLETLQRKVQGATRERMLRELAEAIEVLTTDKPLVLWLEDLQWSDVSTLDWLAFVARRQERARLLVIGTYRPVDVLVREHSLKAVKQELRLHRQCQELALDFLTEEHVTEYLIRRFAVGATHAPPGRAPLQLARFIHQRTDGNPLFMVNVINHLITQDVISQVDGRWTLQGGVAAVESGVPESLQQMIEQQIEWLNPADQRVLEIASVVGMEFSAAAVAAGAEVSVEVVEEQCAELVRREQFLRANGTAEWPDGTVATRYEFLHALYQEVLYERVTAGRRARLHQRIGERVEAAYGDRAGKMAAELAVHFERGRDYRRAIQYLEQAGKNAIRRSAHRDAISLLSRGLELLKSLPDTSEHAQQELTLQIALGAPLGMTKGFAAPEVERVHARTWELCQHMEETPQLFRVFEGLRGFYLLRGELRRAHEVGERLLHVATSVQDPPLLLTAYTTRGVTHVCLGEFTAARAHFEQALTLFGPERYRSYALLSNISPSEGLSWTAWTLGLLGYPDQALERSREALTLARESSRPFALAAALNFAAALHRLRREVQAVQERAEAAMALSTEHDFALLLGLGTMLRGWALAEQGHGEEGIAQMRHGITAYRNTGAELNLPCWLVLLAEAYGKIGKLEEGLSTLAEAGALVEKNEERYYEAELYRLKGELTLQKFQVSGSTFQAPKSPESEVRSPESQAEECFRQAIAIARRQSAKSWELRAVMSLSRLWRSQGKKKEAHKLLSEIYGWFTEGFDTKDLQEAKALLEELGGN